MNASGDKPVILLVEGGGRGGGSVEKGRKGGVEKGRRGRGEGGKGAWRRGGRACEEGGEGSVEKEGEGGVEGGEGSVEKGGKGGKGSVDSEGTIHVATVKYGWRLRTRAISKKVRKRR